MWRSTVAVLAALLWWLVTITPAQAHAVLVGSDPADGAVLDAAPSVVKLYFSEDIVSRLSSVSLIGGGSVRPPDPVRQPGDSSELVARIAPLPVGDYGLRWRVMAADDGHTTSGTVLFSVGTARNPAALDAQGPAVHPVTALLEWLWLLTLAVILGGMGLITVVLPRPIGGEDAGHRHGAEPRALLLRTVSAAAVAGMAVSAAEVLARSNELGRVDVTTMRLLTVDSRWGLLLLARLVLLAVLLLVLGRAGRAVRRDQVHWRRSAGADGVVLVLALGLAAVSAAQGHAAAVGGGAWLTVAADAVHIAAACTWIGSLFGLVAVLIGRHRSGRSTALLDELAVRFSTGALLAVGILIASGLYGTSRQVDQLSQLFSSEYGRLLLTKVGLLSVLLLLGWRNFRRLHPARSGVARTAASPRVLSQRAVTVEAALGALVLLVASWLGQSPPAREPTLAAAGGTSGVATSGSWIVSVAVNPDRVGVNGFTVTLTSSRRPAPSTARPVLLRIEGGNGADVVVSLRPVSEQTSFGTAALSAVPTAVSVQLDVGTAIPLTLPAVGTNYAPGAGADNPSAAGSRWTRVSTYADPAAGLSLLVLLLALALVRRRFQAAVLERAS
ncbi:copper resistance protein CopC/CopD [Jatrophihabitans telluris]|uniref:Copper resistance protein CopC/CopD n=1 Tax=Jatrophihabitans telluris TaxID=2038343 RepID=A0ABY4R0L7_9ACTN|nr:copper resistance protein CopC [Jatrophihabitans telluris]UQX88806.1 copper resistance protein CopC/CopD [Jatrophihabitans telluris]